MYVSGTTASSLYTNRSAAVRSSGAQTGSDPSGSDGVRTADFSNMTRKGLFDWVNSQIQSGAMTLDGSETFISMTVGGRLDEAYSGPDDTEQVDFMQSAREGVEWARQHRDTDLMTRLQTALDTMQRSQGRVSGVNVSV